MLTTQMLNFQLAEGNVFSHPGSPAFQQFEKAGKEVLRQAGLDGLYFGTHEEQPSTLTIILHSSTEEPQSGLSNSDALKMIQQSLDSVTPGELEVLTVDFKPNDGLDEALSAPVTEVALFRFEGEPPDHAHHNVEKAAKALIESGAKIQGWSYGITNEILEKDGLRGNAALLIGGWESIEKHMEVRRSRVFRENMQYIGNGTKGVEAHHVKFQRLTTM